MRLSRAAYEGRDGGNADDASAVVLEFHLAGGGLGCVESAGEVYRYVGVEEGFLEADSVVSINSTNSLPFLFFILITFKPNHSKSKRNRTNSLQKL